MERSFETPKLGDILVIDCIAHQLTGVQILWLLLRHWKSHSNPAAILMCKRGRTQAAANTLRVNLSREREKRDLLRTFELRFSDAIPVDYIPSGEAPKYPAELAVVARVAGGRSTMFAAAIQRLSPGKEITLDELVELTKAPAQPVSSEAGGGGT